MLFISYVLVVNEDDAVLATRGDGVELLTQGELHHSGARFSKNILGKILSLA